MSRSDSPVDPQYLCFDCNADKRRSKLRSAGARRFEVGDLARLVILQDDWSGLADLVLAASPGLNGHMILDQDAILQDRQHARLH